MNNPYRERYKKLSAQKLLEILENKKDYELLAVETAKAELESRNLDAADLEKIGREREEASRERQDRELALKQKHKALRTKAFRFLEYADPLMEKKPERSVMILIFVLAFLLIVKIAGSASMIWFVFKQDGLSSLISDPDFLENFYILTVIILLWKKSYTGWLLMFLWLCYRLIMTGILAYQVFQLRNVDGPLAGLITLPGVSTSLFTMAFYGGVLYFINKPDVKALFPSQKDSIDRQHNA